MIMNVFRLNAGLRQRLDGGHICIFTLFRQHDPGPSVQKSFQVRPVDKYRSGKNEIPILSGRRSNMIPDLPLSRLSFTCSRDPYRYMNKYRGLL